tara:strand:- start:446 stop:1966 length:1521 start_codon:yes stop_codon:yes gene_type:complete
MIHHARKQRQIKNLARRIADEVTANGGQLTIVATKWMEQLRRMYQSLIGCISCVSLRRLALSLGLILTVHATNAQSFAPSILDPHGLSANGQVAEFELVDIDGDGDLDMIGRTSGYGYSEGSLFTFQENSGTPESASFEPVSTPFGIQTIDGLDEFYSFGGNALEIADIDGDGDLDILTIDAMMYGYSYDPYTYVNELSPVTFFENTGTTQAPAFEVGFLNPFGLSLAPIVELGWSIQSVQLTDLDGDSDLDLLGSASQFSLTGNSQYFFFACENQGTVESAVFDTPTDGPFGLPAFPDPFEEQETEGLVTSMDFVDLDGDGDQDLMVSALEIEDLYSYNLTTNLYYYKNTGSSSAPDFSTPPLISPFGLEQVSSLARIQFADIDADGDDDVFSAAYVQYDNTVNFQENISPVSVLDNDWSPLTKGFVWPNILSAGDPIQIRWPGPAASVVQCEIRDQAGRLVQTLRLAPSSVYHALSLPPGHYVVVLRDESTARAFTDRIVVVEH